MKKLLLTTVLIFCGCKSMDEKGRLEKIRIMVPAFIDIEMEYYKDEENKGKLESTSKKTDTVNGYPRLMERTR